MIDGSIIGEPLPPEGQRPYVVPSLYAPKQRLRDDPDLVEVCQQQAIVIAYMMEWRDLKSFEIPAKTARELRMSQVEVEADESGRIFVRRES